MSEQLAKQATPTTDFGMPRLGFGTYRLHGFECYEAVTAALEAGYRHFDTAMAYENEAELGRAIEASDVDRDCVFLTSKIKGYAEFLESSQLRRSAEQTLTRMGIDHLDLLLVHWWNPRSDMRETFGAMGELVDDGLVDHVGVSNFSPGELDAAIAASPVPIATNQVEYHPYVDRTELLTHCRNHDVTLTAYSPLAEGWVTKDETLRRIGEQYEKSPAQVAIRWLLQQDGVATIPKSATPGYIEENFEVFDFELSEGEMRRIDALNGPLWYRLNAEGGAIFEFRRAVGPYVPRRVRELVNS